MVSSTFTSSIISHRKPEGPGSGEKPIDNKPSDGIEELDSSGSGSGNEQKTQPQTPDQTQTTTTNNTTNNSFITICLTVYIFRGEPIDTYNNRHALLYLTSPDLPTYHETVHTQRDEATDLWVVGRLHQPMSWFETRAYVAHVNAGSLRVPAGREMAPADTVAAVPAGARPPDWNCQNFLYEGFQALVDQGLQTQEWWDEVVSEMMDKLLDSTVV